MVETGSEEWAQATLGEALYDLGQFESTPAPLASDFVRLGKYKGWKKLKNKANKFFKTFQEFCIEPIPQGLNRDPVALQRRVNRRQEGDEQLVVR